MSDENEPTTDNRNIHQRMLAVMAKCTYIQKDQRKVAGQYTAVKHDAVVAKVRGYLLEQGILAVTTVDHCEVTACSDGQRSSWRAEAKVTVSFINADNPADCIRVQSFGSGDDRGDKAVGKAISYATKYAILKALMLETGDDADHDASAESAPVLKDAEEKCRVAIRRWFAQMNIDEAVYGEIGKPLNELPLAKLQEMASKLETPESRKKLGAMYKAHLAKKQQEQEFPDADEELPA
jgi:hypothetical protein